MEKGAFKTCDTVQLLVDLEEGKDFISHSKQTIRAGSIGTVIEMLNEEEALVEFSYKEYKDPVTGVLVEQLKKV